MLRQGIPKRRRRRGRVRTAAAIAVGGLVLALSIGTASGALFKFERAWKHPGPDGMGVAPNGNVYVTDGDRITRYNRRGKRLGRWGEPGDAPGEFASAKGIAIDRNGRVYVADYANDRVQIFSAKGTFLTGWETSDWGPWDVAVGGGKVFVLDVRNDLVHRFTPDGTYLGNIGGTGTGRGKFSSPCGIAANKSGNFYVSETGTDRVQRFKPSGAFVSKWGRKGTKPGRFYNPCGIAVDPKGFVYVGDTPPADPRIQRFRKNGKRAGKPIVRFGRRGRDKFNSGVGLGFDRKNNLYAAEKSNSKKRIVKLRRR